MHSVCIAPFGHDELPLASCPPPDWDIQALYAPKGMGIDGVDVSRLTNRPKLGYIASSNLDECVSCAQLVVIPHVRDSLRCHAHRAIEEALAQGKSVVCFMGVDGEKRAEYERCARDNAATIQFLQRGKIPVWDSDDRAIKPIGVPVVYVVETVKGMDGFEVSLRLKQALEHDGHDVCMLWEDDYGVSYGEKPIELLSGSSLEEMIVSLNRYADALCARRLPDVVVVHLPQPIMSFNNIIHYDCGASAYVISAALPPDVIVACTPMNISSVEMLDGISEASEYKLGCSIDYVHVANKDVDMPTDERMGKLEVIHRGAVSYARQIDALRAAKDTVYDLLDTKDFANFYNCLKDNLFNVEFGLV